MTQAPIKQRVVMFEGIGICFYRTEEFREPLRGEFYLSGTIVMAYRALNNLTTKYQVVVPTYEAVPTNMYWRGKAIKVDTV
jgi:hypothetical protein